MEAYKGIFSQDTITRSFLNSVIYTSLGTAINMLLTTAYAYALSRKRMTFRKFYTFVAMIPMYFSGGMIPSFLLIAKSLKMYNTLWALVLPGAISTVNMLIMRAFFMSIPNELEESAYLDGANDITILWRIILPLSRASIFTIALYYMVGHWNSWFGAMIYLHDESKFPLQMILRKIVLLSEAVDEASKTGDLSMKNELYVENYVAIKYAVLVVSMVPMLLVYPFIQNILLRVL